MVSFIKKFFICLMCCASPLMGMDIMMPKSIADYMDYDLHLSIDPTNPQKTCEDMIRGLNIAIEILNSNKDAGHKALDEWHKKKEAEGLFISSHLNDALSVVQNLIPLLKAVEEGKKQREEIYNDKTTRSKAINLEYSLQIVQLKKELEDKEKELLIIKSEKSSEALGKELKKRRKNKEKSNLQNEKETSDYLTLSKSEAQTAQLEQKKASTQKLKKIICAISIAITFTTIFAKYFKII
jgi:hypothetical protein